MYALTQATFGSNRLAAPELSREDHGPPDVIAKGWKLHRGAHWTFELLDHIFHPTYSTAYLGRNIGASRSPLLKTRPCTSSLLPTYWVFTYSMLSMMTTYDITIYRDTVSAWNLCRLFVWLPARAQSALQFFVLMASIPHCSIAQSSISRCSMLLSVLSVSITGMPLGPAIAAIAAATPSSRITNIPQIIRTIHGVSDNAWIGSFLL